MQRDNIVFNRQASSTTLRRRRPSLLERAGHGRADSARPCLRQAHVFLAATLCAWTAFAIGCSDKPYGLAPVSGVVTLDGQLASGVDISFQPQSTGDANPGPGSAGTCDDAGRYELQTQTLKGEPGAVVGVHSVRIYSHRPAAPSASDTDATPRKERIPARYNFETQLTFTVPADGTTSADFALTTKPE